MDSSESQNVLFHSVRDCYILRPDESIACQYAVLPSMTKDVRDYVGIFKVGWKSTRECLTSSLSPTYHSVESTVKDNSILFDGK